MSQCVIVDVEIVEWFLPDTECTCMDIDNRTSVTA